MRLVAEAEQQPGPEHRGGRGGEQHAAVYRPHVARPVQVRLVRGQHGQGAAQDGDAAHGAQAEQAQVHLREGGCMIAAAVLSED